VSLFGLAFLLVAVPFGLLLEQVKRSGPLLRLDASAARNLHAWVRGSDDFVRELTILTFFGSPVWFYLIVTPAVIWVWRQGHVRLAVFLVLVEPRLDAPAGHPDAEGVAWPSPVWLPRTGSRG